MDAKMKDDKILTERDRSSGKKHTGARNGEKKRNDPKHACTRQLVFRQGNGERARAVVEGGELTCRAEVELVTKRAKTRK